MTRSPTVLVVGGGATGTARDLALRGVEVMLVERNGLSSGASSRSHGLLHSGARYAEAVSDLVCDRLGVDAECETATRPLPGAEDPDQLDDLVVAYDGQGPPDADISGRD